jgi:hypothetical protein
MQLLIIKLGDLKQSLKRYWRKIDKVHFNHWQFLTLIVQMFRKQNKNHFFKNSVVKIEAAYRIDYI